MDLAIRLLVGLGNPDPSYDRTRHNIGRAFIDHLAQETRSSYRTSRQAEFFRLADFFGPAHAPVFCIRLLTFMNGSGPAVREFMGREGIQPEQILVIYDDFMIPFGSLRLRPKGSAGGHNGMKSLIESLGTQEFGRLRLGIGPTPAGRDPADFVLGKLSKPETANLPMIYSATRDTVQILLNDGFEKAMNFANRNHLDETPKS